MKIAYVLLLLEEKMAGASWKSLENDGDERKEVCERSFMIPTAQYQWFDAEGRARDW